MKKVQKEDKNRKLYLPEHGFTQQQEANRVAKNSKGFIFFSGDGVEEGRRALGTRRWCMQHIYIFAAWYAGIKTHSAKNPKLSKVLSLTPGTGQNIDSHAPPAAWNSSFLTSTFAIQSTWFFTSPAENRKSGVRPGHWLQHCDLISSASPSC